MRCPKCGQELEANSNVCPNCQCVVSNDEDMEVLETINVSENMAPPSLDVNKENLTAGVKDISSNSDSESIYENEEDIKEEVPAETEKKDDVQISIPSVSNIVENADSVTGVVSESDKKEKKVKLNFRFNIKGTIPTLYCLVACFGLLVLGLLLGKTFFSTNICAGGKKVTDINTKVVASGKNNETYVSGYLFKIPKDFAYDKINGGLLIFDETGNVRIFFKAYKGLYDNLAVAKTSIKETIEESGVRVSSIEEKSLVEDGIKYVIATVTTQNRNRLIAFRKFDDENVFYVEIIDNTNNYNEEALKVADDIISNVKAAPGSTLEKIDVFDYSEVAITAANEYKSLISH